MATIACILIPRSIPQTAANPIIEAKIEIDPDRFGGFRFSKYFIVYLEMPAPYSVFDINVSSILLNGIVEIDPEMPPTIGDYDNDGIPDLAINFTRNALLTSTAIGGYEWYFFGQRVFKSIHILSGTLIDDTAFNGIDTLLVIWPRVRPE